MADAKKCDRCGAFYDLETNDKARAFITIDIYENGTSYRKRIDLCSDCVGNFWEK